MRWLSPVTIREAASLVRQRRHYVLRALFLGSLLAYVGFSWMSRYHYYNRFDFTEMPVMGRMLFQTFLQVEVFILVLVVPIMMATAVAGEKEKDTLGLLMMTNVGAWGILASKWMSRFLVVLLLILSGTPLLLALLTFGGVTPGGILLGLLALLGVVLFSSGISLLVSTLAESSISALMCTYVLMGVYVVWSRIMGTNDTHQWWLPVALMESEPAGVRFLVVAALVFVFCMAVARILLPRYAGQHRASFLKQVSARLNAFYDRINFTRVVILDERELHGHPMMWKELHRSFFSSTTFLLRALAFTLGAWMVVFCLAVAFKIEPLHEVGGLLIPLVFCVGAVVLSANAFSSDREHRTLQVLLTTPVSARAIVLSRYLGLLKMLIPAVVPFMLWMCVLLWVNGISDRDLRGMGQTLLAVLVFLPGCLLIGLLCSMRYRVGAAILLTFGTIIAWSLLPGLLVFARVAQGASWLFGVGGTHDWTDPVETTLYSLSPVAGVMLAVEGELVWQAVLWLIPLWGLILLKAVRGFDAWMGRT